MQTRAGQNELHNDVISYHDKVTLIRLYTAGTLTTPIRALEHS